MGNFFSSDNENSNGNSNGNSNEMAQLHESQVPQPCGDDKGMVVSKLHRPGFAGIVPRHPTITEGCSRLDYTVTSDNGREKCITSFEKKGGKYYNCEWVGEPRTGTCVPESDECIPEMAGSTDKPYCSTDVWQPWHYLGNGIAGKDSSGEILYHGQYCYCKDTDIGFNHTNPKTVASRCTKEDTTKPFKGSNYVMGVVNYGKVT